MSNGVIREKEHNAKLALFEEKQQVAWEGDRNWIAVRGWLVLS